MRKSIIDKYFYSWLVGNHPIPLFSSEQANRSEFALWRNNHKVMKNAKTDRGRALNLLGLVADYGWLWVCPRRYGAIFMNSGNICLIWIPQSVSKNERLHCGLLKNLQAFPIIFYILRRNPFGEQHFDIFVAKKSPSRREKTSRCQFIRFFPFRFMLKLCFEFSFNFMLRIVKPHFQHWPRVEVPSCASTRDSILCSKTCQQNIFLGFRNKV